MEEILYCIYRLMLRTVKKCRESLHLLFAGTKRKELKNDIGLRKKIHTLFYQKEYRDALDCLDRISEKEPYDYSCYANCYYRMGEQKKAVEAIKERLVLVSGQDADFFIELLDSKFAETGDSFSSEYSFLGGNENVGVIIHKSGDSIRYITIISEAMTDPYTKECYDRLLSMNAELETVLSPVVFSVYYGKMVLNTFPYIARVEKRFEIESVVRVSRLIEKTPITGNEAFFTHFNHKGNLSKVLFRYVNSRFVVDRIFEKLCEMAEKKNSERSAELFLKIREIVRKNRLYRLVDYGFLAVSHGDFSAHNILFYTQDGEDRLCVIDNGHFTVSLKGYDLAFYLSTKPVTFMDVKEKVLDAYRDDLTPERGHAWEVFFLMMVCYRKLVKGYYRDADVFYGDLFLPIYEYIRQIYPD